jgi:hypothetical protein
MQRSKLTVPSVLTYVGPRVGRPDREGAQPPSLAEGNLNPKAAKEGLCPPYSAGESVRPFWAGQTERRYQPRHS